MNNTKYIETDRLILRKFTLDDAEGMFNNWATDPKTNYFLGWPLHKNVEETKSVISNWIRKYEEGSYNWIIEEKESHEVIGSICEEGKKDKFGVIELGYCFGSRWWSKGYGTEALRAVIEYLLEEQGYYLVEANYRSTNPASGRVMEKAGMKYDGTLRGRKVDPDGTRSDVICYSITKEEL